MSNKLTIKYSFKKVGYRSYIIEYSAYDTEGTIKITNERFNYQPITEFKDNNEVRNGCYKAMRNLSARAWDFRGSVSIICLNPQDEFLSKGKKYKQNQQYEAPTVPVVASSDTERKYLLVQKDGVWTIEKSNARYLTEKEAQKELIKRITGKGV